MDIRERFWTWWFDGVPQPVADRMFKRVVDDEVHKLADRLADENRTLREQVEELTRQRDDAQDEIEKLISEIATLRAVGDSPGVGMIAEERSRQVNVEGYSREHDAEHGHMQLAQAATAYALGGASFWWPWNMESFKPTRDPVRDLTKAGALIAAALDVKLADNATPRPAADDPEAREEPRVDFT